MINLTDCTFSDNTALEAGDDFYLSNTEGAAFKMNRVKITNPYAKTSIYTQNVNIQLN